MPQIDVCHLRLRGRPEQASRAEFAIADALRTAVADDGRLVLVRRLGLGRVGFRGQAAALAAGAAWRDVIGAARHGGSSGAEGANCVWFIDAAEARRLLLRELARGRTPAAWFWALAVPDWRGLSLGAYLRSRLELALNDRTGASLAALWRDVVAAECCDELAAAIVAGLPTPPAAALASQGARTALGRSSGGSRDFFVSAEAPSEGAEAQLVAALVSSVPAVLRQVLAQAAAQPPGLRLIEQLARGLVLRAHPALALAPASLAATQAAVAHAVRGARVGREAPARSLNRAPISPRDTATFPPQPPARVSLADAQSLPSDIEPPSLTAAGRTGQALRSAPPVAQHAAESAEMRSEAAGLFLAIVPLVRLGWRDWLAARPDVLFEQPGARLLRHIAARYRVARADAVWGALPAVEPGHDLSPTLAEALDCWRAGLDRWLRRTVRRRLADVVLRRGWILDGPETTLVRFPLNRIEIALRRRALDGDPGWVDWLGHGYRIVYRDAPMTGAGE